MPLAHLSDTAPPAKTLPSLPEVESALIAPTHAPPVMEPEPALLASVDSTTSKVLARLHAPMEPTP